MSEDVPVGCMPPGMKVRMPTINDLEDEIRAHAEWGVGDMVYYQGEKAMTFDFEGGIKKVDGHYLVKLGCQYYIVHDSKEAGKLLAKVFKENFEGKDEVE